MRRACLAAALVTMSCATQRSPTTPADKCLAAKLDAVATYAACRLTVTAAALRARTATDFSRCDGALVAAYAAAETAAAGTCPTTGDVARVRVRVTGDAGAVVAASSGTIPTALRRLPATGQTKTYRPDDDGGVRAGAALRFVDNGDGSVTDVTTALVWEKKSGLDGTPDPTSLHDADNCYAWSRHCRESFAICITDADCGLNQPCMANRGRSCNPNGLTIFEWLAQLNAANFAGHNDWRIPNAKELHRAAEQPLHGRRRAATHATPRPLAAPCRPAWRESAPPSTRGPTRRC